MTDERKESIEQGIAPPPESEIGKRAERERQRELINAPDDTRPDGGLGGTSDADSAGDEAWTPPPQEP